MSQLHDDLVRVRGVLDARGWCANGAGCTKGVQTVCLEEACAEAVFGDRRLWGVRPGADRVTLMPNAPGVEWQDVELTEAQVEAIPRYVALQDALKAQVDRMSIFHGCDLWMWNDSASTSLGDVKAVLAAATAAAE